MSNENDNMALSEKLYNERYSENIISCVNSISRSYSSGIDAPSISSNRLRVYSTDSKCPGPLRVRSSPSSPNRLSRFQCMTMVRRKWSAVNKINQSSSSEFDSYPTSCNSNKSLQCDCNLDQLQVVEAWKHDSSTYSLTNRPTSCHNLQVNDQSMSSQDDFYPLSSDLRIKLSGSPSMNLFMKQSKGITAEECNAAGKSGIDCGKDRGINDLTQVLLNNERSAVAHKLASNPINFKKALRDRYLNSQVSSNDSTFTSTSSSHNKTTSLTDDCLFYPNELSLPEREDHNFRLIQDRGIKSSFDIDSCNTPSMSNIDSKKSLSIDLRNLSARKKYRIRSTNSTVSSMSGVEAEGDPFSPASTEICSPFLKLKLPYRTLHKEISGCCTPNVVPSTSLGTIQSSHEEQCSSSLRTTQSITAQRFFPETMKLSDFHVHPIFKSDCQLDSNIKERLMFPLAVDGRINSKSAPQSLQLSPNCSSLLSGSITPNTCLTIDSAQSLSYVSMMNTDEDIYFSRPIMSSKSMDYLDTCYSNEDNCITLIEGEEGRIKKNVSQNKKCESIKATNIAHKSKHTSSLSQISKKSVSLSNASSQRQCSVCGRHFNRSDMLARHSRVHTGHKPFECSICGQSFSRSDHLNTHMRIHSGEKPYQCSLCSYSACRRDMITRHLRVHRRKGDISADSISVLVVNTQKTAVNKRKKVSISKSHSSFNIDPGTVSDDCNISPLHRSQSFNDSNQSCYKTDQNSPPSSSATTETGHIVPKTFANISISICQPTPRSSFSMPMESINDSQRETFPF